MLCSDALTHCKQAGDEHSGVFFPFIVTRASQLLKELFDKYEDCKPSRAEPSPPLYQFVVNLMVNIVIVSVLCHVFKPPFGCIVPWNEWCLKINNNNKDETRDHWVERTLLGETDSRGCFCMVTVMLGMMFFMIGWLNDGLTAVSCIAQWEWWWGWCWSTGTVGGFYKTVAVIYDRTDTSGNVLYGKTDTDRLLYFIMGMTVCWWCFVWWHPCWFAEWWDNFEKVGECYSLKVIFGAMFGYYLMFWY